MKKILFLMALILCAVLCVFGLSGCGKLCTKHEFTQAECIWNDEHTEATVIITCEKCGEKISENADVKYEQNIDATCTDDGLIVYSATVQIGGNTFNRYAEETVIPAKGHTYKSPTYEFKESAEGYECIGTKACKKCDVKETSTVPCEVTTVLSPTCTREGKQRLKASFEDDVFSTQTKDITVAKLPHEIDVDKEWDESYRCTVSGTCATCRQFFTETKQGTLFTIEESTCTVHGKGYYAAEFDTPGIPTQKKNVVLPFKHDESYGYEWIGFTSCIATSTCKLCNELLAEETGTITDEIILEPTCTAYGEREYTATFDTIPSRTKTDSIEKLPHSYGGATYGWSDDHLRCSATVACTVCDKKVSQTVDAVPSTKPKSCTVDGENKYVATFTDTNIKEEEREAIYTEVIPMSHEYDTVSYTWTEYTSCSASGTCKVCNTPTVEEADITDDITTPVTCTTDGERTYTAKFDTLGVDTKVERIVKIGHDYGEIVYTWNKEYSECTGTKTCANCGDAPAKTSTSVSLSILTVPDCDTEGEAKITAVFAEEGYGKEITTTLPAGHRYELRYVWDIENMTCTATKVCTVCNTVEATETKSADPYEVIENDDGSTTFSYTVTFLNAEFESQTYKIDFTI